MVGLNSRSAPLPTSPSPQASLSPQDHLKSEISNFKSPPPPLSTLAHRRPSTVCSRGMHYFITGTSTDAGKTYVTCLLLRALTAQGTRAVGFKPVTCGGREDAIALRDAGTPGPDLDLINPVAYRQPLSPMAAALLENRPFDDAPILAAWAELTAQYDRVLVEGAGGWEVPLSKGRTIADLAALLNLPVIVVADNRLGSLNHTILTVRAIQHRGLSCAGIILNHPADSRDLASISNSLILQSMLDVPILAEIMHGETDLDWPSLV